MKTVELSPDCSWDEASQKVLVYGKEVKLTLSQTRLVEILVRNLGQPVSSVDMYYYIWEDYSKEYNEKSIRNLVSKVRKVLPHLQIQNIYGGYYKLESKHDLPDNDFKEYLFEILQQSQNAMVITDPNQNDNPIIYVNGAYTKMFGYTMDEVAGRNCRFMHKDDHEQLGLMELKAAIENESQITVTIRNYRKDETIVHNQLTVSPIFDKNSGELKYFLGIHKDVTYINHLIDMLQDAYHAKY